MKSRQMRVIVVVAITFLAAGCSKAPTDFLQQGKAFRDKGELASAVIAFKNAVQADGESLDARLLLAESQERAGDITAAEEQYRKALALGGNGDDLMPRIAALMLDRGDMPALSREFIDRQLALPSADSQLRGIVAIAELAQRHAEAAQAQLARAEGTAPAVQLARAEQALFAGKLDDARATLAALAKDGNSPWWLQRQVGRAFASLGDRDNALVALGNANRQVGNHSGLIAEYAEQLFEAGRIDEARPLREKLHKIAPKYFRTALVDALFQIKDEQLDQAHESLEKVLAAAPEFAPALLLAARLEMDRGQKELAETHVKKVLARNPASVAALRILFNIELERGDKAAAAATLARALDAAPNDRRLLSASANLAWEKGDKAQALQQLTRAAQTEPPQADLLARLAEMQAALGKSADAAKTLGQATELTSDNAAAREQVFRSALRMRRVDKARLMAEAEMARRPGEPAPFLWMAAVLANENKRPAALDQIRRALDLKVDHFGALLLFQSLASKPEELKEYDDRLRKAVDSGSKDVRVYAERARRLRRTGADAGQVAAVLERGAAADPKSLRMQQMAIAQWLAAGDKQKAVALAKSAESAQPGNPTVMALAAATLEAAGKPEEAAAKFADLEARNPDRMDWGALHAQALARAGKMSDAVSVLRRLIARSPDDATPYQMLIAIQLDQKQETDAIATANALVERPKRRAIGLLLLGDLQLRLNARDEAMKAYEAARSEGAQEEAALRIVQLKAKSGDDAGATAELRSWLTAHPSSVPGLGLAAARDLAKSDYSSAVRNLEAIVKLQPTNVVALNDLAWSYAQTRNPAAMVTARKALALAPENPVILDTMAEVQARAGQKEEALETLRTALALAPANGSIRVHLAELLIEKGERKEAGNLVAGVDAKTLDADGARRLGEVKKRL